MRKIMKRGFCLFLVAVLLAGLVPYAFADEAKPTDVSEDAAEPTEETTAPPETTVPSESTEPPSEATEPPVTTEATEPDADPVEDDMEDDRLLSDSISTYASTVSNVLLFDQASPNYTTVLKSQISVTYQPNGTDSIKTAYIKNLGWHFARYNNTPYEDDPIYCIEPCKNYAASTSGNYMDQDLGVSGSGSSRGSNVWYAMPSSYRQAIALTLLYSKQLWNSNYSVKTTAMANNPNVSTRIATQFLIYEIVTGLRDANTFNRKSSNGYSSGDVFYNAGVANVSGFADKYNSIVSSVQSAMKVPSFTGRSSGSAPTITMSGSQVSVKDSNGVLGNFSFANGNGASFSKSGNTLTITKTGTISPSTVFSATRSLPSAENSTVSIYYSASSTYQTCVKLYSPQVETLRAYFKINAPNPGAIALVKTTEDGQNLSGWRFGVYSNAACTTLVSGPHTTDSSGKISITGLNAGTYYVKELGHTDAGISSRYTCSGGNPQKVTVSNGATATVSFYNKLAVGALEIRKSTNTGNHLDGWKFIVKKDGAEIPGSPFTTNETGIIRISNLAPGKYLVLESPTEDPYWSVELGYHTVTVEYGKTAVDQWLNKEQGLGYFTKSTNTGDEISGWHITVYADEACTQELHTLITGQDGTVCVYLEPGTYWVKETGSEKYLQYSTLKEKGLLHFDAWASTFGETVTAIELAPEGTGYRSKTRFAKFFNLPELMSMFKEIADIQTADMLKLPVPEAEYHNVVLQPSEQQKKIVASLSERAEKVRNKQVDSNEDNMLVITNDGRKLALDQRLINPMLPDSDTGKVAVCAENVYNIWERTAEKKSTQMVFVDLSTPHNDGQFNVYDDLKKKLLDKGIPESEIAYIHDAKTEAAKKELFGKVRSGEVRVLIGSTQKMGAGTNAQREHASKRGRFQPHGDKRADLHRKKGCRNGNSGGLQRPDQCRPGPPWFLPRV